MISNKPGDQLPWVEFFIARHMAGEVSNSGETERLMVSSYELGHSGWLGLFQDLASSRFPS